MIASTKVEKVFLLWRNDKKVTFTNLSYIWHLRKVFCGISI